MKLEVNRLLAPGCNAIPQFKLAPDFGFRGLLWKANIANWRWIRCCLGGGIRTVGRVGNYCSIYSLPRGQRLVEADSTEVCWEGLPTLR
jgi:hypothetical protein